METIDIWKLVGAIVLAYLIMFLTMWLFKRKKKENKPKK
jgi:hypothetical protein